MYEQISDSLFNSDWLFISQIIYRVNISNTYEEFSTTLLTNAKRLFNFSLGIIWHADIINGIAQISTPYSIDKNGNYHDASYYLESNYKPKWFDYLYSPWSSVFRYSDISNDAEWTKSQIFKEVLTPLNLYYGLYTTLIHNDKVVGAVVFWRSKDEKDFSRREMFIMECLKNHLALKMYNIRFNEQTAYTDTDNFQKHLADFSQKFSLTRREMEITQCVLTGKDTEEICSTLFISDSTLRKHLYNIYQKTKVNSRPKLVKLFKQLY